jgi:hypothetical protein
MAPAARADAPFHKRAKHARQGPLRAEISYRLYSFGNGYWDHGRIRIWNRGRLIVNRTGYGGGSIPPALTIRQLDGSGPQEVILDTYSGGVHCCSDTTIFTGKHRTRKEWGHFGGPTLRDVDGDGKPEFHGYDSSFAGAFGSFASSRLPAKVWNYSGNAIHDVTASYPAEVQADMAKWYADYQSTAAESSGEGVQASLAAYAADAFTLGQGDAAMAVVQAADDAGETSNPDFLPDEDFVTRLRKMLRDLGYDKSAG